jgi:hypothetical protein
MKTALNVLAVVSCVLWGGWIVLEDFARNMGGAANPRLNHGEVGAAVIFVVSVAVVVSVIASRRTEGKRAWGFVALSFLLVAVGHAFLTHRRSSAMGEELERERARRELVQSRFDAIPADFRHRGSFGEYPDPIDSILVIEADTQSLVRVDNQGVSLSAFCVARIRGSTLEVYDEPALREDYADDAGRTVQDRFTVVPGTEPDAPECDYERYTF